MIARRRVDRVCAIGLANRLEIIIAMAIRPPRSFSCCAALALAAPLTMFAFSVVAVSASYADDGGAQYVELDTSADFDRSRHVDDRDLSKWEGDFSVGAGSDADGDGKSGGDDFLVWQRQNGRSVPAPANDDTSLNPEPGALVVWGALASLGGLFFARRGRRS
jgi:hypothetical protein